jgi:hypothetical protein
MISFEDCKKLNIRIELTGPHLGDNLILSHLPENFFKNTGKKLIGDKNNQIFKYNPFIDDKIKPDIICTHQQICDGGSNLIRNIKNIHPHQSIAMEHCHFFSLPKCYLRNSRIYIYEDVKTVHNKVCVHTTGKSVGTLPDKVIEIIEQNYEHYHLVQVGGTTDKKIKSAEDKTGLGFFETAKEIAESAIFIGIDSGAGIRVADCYPKVRKKYIINYMDEEQLEKSSPLYKDSAWWEFNMESYNCYEYDIGCSMSYLKI